MPRQLLGCLAAALMIAFAGLRRLSADAARSESARQNVRQSQQYEQAGVQQCRVPRQAHAAGMRPAHRPGAARRAASPRSMRRRAPAAARTRAPPSETIALRARRAATWPNPAPGFANKPEHRVDLLPETPPRRASPSAAQTIADSTAGAARRGDRPRPVHYIPEKDVRLDLMRPTEHQTHCPFKGDARIGRSRSARRHEARRERGLGLPRRPMTRSPGSPAITPSTRAGSTAIEVT